VKTPLKVDFINQKIIMSRTFAKKAKIYGSNEFKDLLKAREGLEEYELTIRKEIKKNAGKECYRGLTYDYMREYILSHTKDSRIIKEFDELLLLSKCHSIRYPKVKQWFLATFPEIEKYNTKKQVYYELQTA